MVKLLGRKSLMDNIQNKNIDHVDLIKNDNLIELLNKNNIKYNIVDNNYFNNFDRSLNHQGVITFINKIEKYNDINDFVKNTNTKSLVVILDEIQDPGNFGAILRSCDAFGVDAVIYKKNNQAPINDFTIKTSAGAINNLNMFMVTNLNATIELLKENKYWIYCSCLDKDSQNYSKVKYDERTVLIIGNEDKGVSQLLINNSDFKIMIPMKGVVQSLNASVSTGILLAEISKYF